MHVAAYILGASALASSLLALFRDRLFAHTFGAGIELDLYYAAFRIPDLLFVALGALVPSVSLSLLRVPSCGLVDEKLFFLTATGCYLFSF